MSNIGYSKREISGASYDVPEEIFKNLPELITSEFAAKVLKKSVSTLYDWNYRGKTRKNRVPSNLFVKVGGGLYLRKDVLIEWAFKRSSS